MMNERRDVTVVDPLISAADEGMYDRRTQPQLPKRFPPAPAYDTHDRLAIARAEGEGMHLRTDRPMRTGVVVNLAR